MKVLNVKKSDEDRPAEIQRKTRLTKLLELKIQKMKEYTRKAFYKITPLTKLRFKPRKGEQYCERRSTIAIGSTRDNGSICKKCHYRTTKYRTEKPEMCSKCGGEMVWIGPIARIPKKNANKEKWDEFFKHCGKMCAGACR